MEIVGGVQKIITGEVVVSRAFEAKKQLEDLIGSLNTNTFTLAELLFEVKTKIYYSNYGYNNFSDYLKEIDIKVSKAQYLTRIIDVMNQVNILRDQYEPLGVGKLREICSLDPNSTYVNPETKEETPMSDYIIGFIERGDKLSLSEIRQHVRTLKGLVGEDDLVWLNFSVKKLALEKTIKPALEQAKHVAGSVGYDEEGNAKDISDGQALEFIAAEFLNDPANSFLAGQEPTDGTNEEAV